MEALAPAWARQEKLGKRVTTKIGHKDLVMTQHGPAQVYQMKARSSEEEKELERRMSVLRKSLPDEAKVNRVISRNNQRCNGGSIKNEVKYPQISKHKKGKYKPIKTKQMQRRQAKINRVRHSYPTPINSEERNKLTITLAGVDGDQEVIALANSGTDGSLISMLEVESISKVNEITKWKGPSYNSLHDQFKIVGELLDEICVNGEWMTCIWCVVMDPVMPLLGLDFLSFHKWRPKWTKGLHRFDIHQGKEKHDVPMYKAPHVLRAVEATKIKKGVASWVTCKFQESAVTPKFDDQRCFIIEPASTTSGALRW